MRAYVAVTDPGWFQFLSAESDLEEVNFWYPKPWGGRFGVLEVGQPLLFKLSRPHNAIAGGGFFRHYTELPLSIAWETFGTLNGADTHLEVWRRITRLRREIPRPGDDPTIGCVLLADPFFWPRDMWIQDPPGWHPNIQRGATFDLREGAGKRIWEMVKDRMASFASSAGMGREPPPVIQGGYGSALLQPRRLGQGTFRALITDAYGRCCAITREKALPALEAAHIRPFSEVRQHSVGNGMLLRSDVHRLFDAGYLTVTPEYRVEASNHMKTDFNDGDNYLALHGATVWVPEEKEFRPDSEGLAWHNVNVFRG